MENLSPRLMSDIYLGVHGLNQQRKLAIEFAPVSKRPSLLKDFKETQRFLRELKSIINARKIQVGHGSRSIQQG